MEPDHHSRGPLIAAFLVVLGGGVALFVRMGKQPPPELGSVPAILSTLPDPSMLTATKQFRTWIETLAPADAKQLAQTGTLRMAWKDLQRKDPAHAKIVSDYVDSQAKSIMNASKGQLGAMPPEKRKEFLERVGVHHDPDTVAIGRQAPGSYMVAIRTEKGMRLVTLVVSEPTPTSSANPEN